MLRQKIAEARKQRAKLIHDARQLIEKAEKEKRELSPEEQAQWDTMMAEVEALKARVDKLEQLAEAEAEGGEGEGQGDGADDGDEESNSRRGRIVPKGRQEGRGEPRTGRASPEYRQSFDRLLRGEASPEDVGTLMRELRAQGLTPKTAGGYLVPNEFEATIVKKLEDENVMRQLGTVLTTVSGDREIPVEADIGAADWLDEAGAYPESDVTLGQAKLGAFKLGRILKVSEELMYDSAFDVETYVADVYARTFGRGEEGAMVSGDGNKKPTGVVQGSQKGADAAKGALTADNIIDLFHGLRVPYRARASFLMKDDTARLIRKLKDNDGQYVWQPGLQAGQPDSILGRPVFYSEYMPAVGTSTKSIVFGDFSYYWIGDRRGRVMQRLDELYAATGQVGIKAHQRIDAKLTLAEAVVHLLHAAV